MDRMYIGYMDIPDADEPIGHPMAVVARRTGLHPDVIRAWERRHGVVRPRRTPGNRRVYLEEDVRRLELVARAVRLGWPIGQLATRTDAQLEELLATSAAGHGSPGAVEEVPAPRAGRAEAPRAVLERCASAISALDAARLRAELDAASVALGRVRVIDDVVAPLMVRVGEGCERGELRIASEHLASSVVARFLDGLNPAATPPASAPGIVVTTPAFQHHEIGALLAAACARIAGWRTTYLGPNLPAEEIAAAAATCGARAIALSIAFPPGEPTTDAELRRLGRLVRGGPVLLAGGASAASYQAALDEAGARRLDDLRALRAWLAAGP